MEMVTIDSEQFFDAARDFQLRDSAGLYIEKKPGI
jgi:hypothetical protein